MQRPGVERFAPLAGIFYVAAAVASFIVFGDTPDLDEPAAEVADHWRDKESEGMISSILGAYGAIALVWFAASLRSAIARVEEGVNRLATLAFSGGVILATGILVDSSIKFAVAESADNVPDGVTHTLGTLYDGFFLVFAGGNALFLFAAGLAIVRYAVLPSWLGWIAIVLGALSVTPAGFFALIASLIWVLIVAVLLFQAESAGTGPAGPEAPVAAPSAGGPPPAV